jgi:hypothetical protein
MLARAATVGETPLLEELALGPVEADQQEGTAAWLPRALAMMSHAAEFPSLHFCVSSPPPPTKRARPEPADELTRKVVADWSAAHANVAVGISARWAVVPQLEPCTFDVASASR